MSPPMERSMSPQVKRCEICRMMCPNAVNNMHSTSRLRKYRLHDREQPDGCTKKLPIEGALPMVIILA